MYIDTFPESHQPPIPKITCFGFEVDYFFIVSNLGDVGILFSYCCAPPSLIQQAYSYSSLPGSNTCACGRYTGKLSLLFLSFQLQTASGLWILLDDPSK